MSATRWQSPVSLRAARWGFILGSPLVLAYALAGAVFWHLVLRRWEEADLERRFGEPYRRYRSQVRCWLPRRTPYQP